MVTEESARAFDRHAHDHGACVNRAVAAAERHCVDRGVRLTAIRRRVLELVWDAGRPVGAYDLLERLGEERGRVAPPTVYRALDFLLEQGLVHRIESRNAFVGCTRPEDCRSGHFLICRLCGATAELDATAIDAALAEAARALGFRIETRTVELGGLCPVCAAEGVAEGAAEGAAKGSADG